MMIWLDELKKQVRGEVHIDENVIQEFSRDASFFEVRPQAVVFAKDVKDIQEVVRIVHKNKKDFPALSITARGAGSDMGGGPLNESIILALTPFMNHFEIDVTAQTASVEPGVYYRDFEPKTLASGLVLPTYPASKNMAALGGMIANNAAGERSLRYGKTADFIEELRAVLADGKEYTFKKLNKAELNKKRAQDNFEGALYRKLHDLLEKNYDIIQRARPKVSKNSAGYALWDVFDRTAQSFDVTRLLCGSQGTLGIITSAKLRLVQEKKHKKLGVIFLQDLKLLPKVVYALLPLEPESLETFDDATLKLALRFFPSIARRIKGKNFFTMLWEFIPEAWLVLKMFSLPKIIILAQFSEDSEESAEQKMQGFNAALRGLSLQKRIFHDEKSAEKYFVIRRESFNLLRNHMGGRRAAPFVDDFIILPEYLPEALPKIYAILEKYNIHATLAGHAGSGNFHIIPLMDLTKASERAKIPQVMEKVYDVVLQYGGSITAEHNDGLIRSPYLQKMFGSEVIKLFEEVKDIFDHQNIFNPGKKVHASLDYAMAHIEHK